MPKGFYASLLLGSRGLLPAFRLPIQQLLRDTLVLRQTLLPFLRDAPATSFPQLTDFPQLASYRETLASIEALPGPTAGYFDSLFVQQQDYDLQGSTWLVSKTGTRRLSLAETVDALLRSTPKLATGSNNTLERALRNAEAFRATLGLEELVLAPYLAMDATWWPTAEAPVLGLVGKNIAVETALLPIQALLNEAVLANPGRLLALDTCHSYASLPRAAALNFFSPREVAYVHSAFLAPLGRVEAMQALLLVKNNFLGKASIIRPGFDPLEELATSHAEAVFDTGNYDLLPTDQRLNGSSHTLQSIGQGIRDMLQQSGLTYADLLERSYTTRPGEVRYYRSPDGTLERSVATRTGEAYSTKAWMKEYTQKLDAIKTAQLDVLKNQSYQLTELVKIGGPTAELQRLATSLKDAQQQLAEAYSYEEITQIKTLIGDAGAGLSTAAQATQHTLSEGQQQDLARWQETAKVQENIAQEASDSLQELEEGAYEPEEISAE